MLRSSPNPTAGPAPRTGPPTARASARSPRGTATRSPAWRDGLLALGLAPRVDLEGGLVLPAARAQRARRDQRLMHRQLRHAAAALVAAAAAELALAGTGDRARPWAVAPGRARLRACPVCCFAFPATRPLPAGGGAARPGAARLFRTSSSTSRALSGDRSTALGYLRLYL